MRGILRPCRHRLGPDLHARWLFHLCGLCLTLADTAGQSARVLTGYDLLLVPVLIEAQTGRLPTSTAGRCPLRAFRTAEVVSADTTAMQSGAAAALLAGGAGLYDKVADGDVPVVLRPLASRAANRLNRLATITAASCGLDGTEVTSAPDRAKAAETRAGAGSALDPLLAAAGTAVASLFAHTAVVAGVPGNVSSLSQAGDAFGRLVHLADAAEDRRSDRRHGRFNPLEATGTSDEEAASAARCLHAGILESLKELLLVDEALAVALLGPILEAAIGRIWMPGSTGEAVVPIRDRPGIGIGLAAAMRTPLAMWGGRHRARRWGDDSFDPNGDNQYVAGYGVGGGYRRRRGPSCGQMLACDCCANCVCNECCGGNGCCCCI
jgi:hypothetical protein